MGKKADTDEEEDLPSPVPQEEPLDEEGQVKKDNVLEALNGIKTSDFTELKTMRAPPAPIA